MSEQRAHNIITIPWMLIVYVALMLLLGLTVLAAHLSIGLLGLAIALLIAATKAILVLLYYMHIRIESPTTRIFAAAGFLWLAIMLTLTTADYLSRPWLNRTEPLPSAQTSEIIPAPSGATHQYPASPQTLPFTPRYKHP
jgi:cytochrome c oxidase subunit 4